jgi:hypothetical protein
MHPVFCHCNLAGATAPAPAHNVGVHVPSRAMSDSVIKVEPEAITGDIEELL